MTVREQTFLQLLSDAIGTGIHEEIPLLSEEDWRSVFILAEQHHVLPLVADEVYKRNLQVTSPFFQLFRKKAMRIVSIQTAKTAAFLSLYQYLSEQGMEPLVMKGVILRVLYPSPDFRFSADEDLLIRPDEVLVYHKALTAYGLKTDHSEDEITASYETTYVSADRVLLLEIHNSPFSPDSVAYGEYNEFFKEAYGNAVTLNIDNVPLRTLSPADHLLYLICHALKHFLHGGFGIRQVADICLFARAYEQEIPWDQMVSRLQVIHGETFAAALFAIGERYLNIPISWQKEEQKTETRKLWGTEKEQTDPEELLSDILESGVYGSSSLSRKHSSGITLGALEKEKKAEKVQNAESTGKGRHFWLRILFPPAERLRERYSYLKKHPILLPAAWTERIFGYFFSVNRKGNSAKEALRIGKERKKLLRKYGLTGNGSPERLKQKDRSKGFKGDETYRKVVDTGEYISSLLELINEGHEVSLPVVGSSMTPFLGDGRDRVFLQEPEGELKKGDVVLYRRDNGDYVLHRICRVRRSNYNDNNSTAELYDIVGDAQTRIERGVRREQILAKVIRIERKGKLKTPGNIYWLFFQYIWVNIIPMRHLILRVYTAIR